MKNLKGGTKTMISSQYSSKKFKVVDYDVDRRKPACNYRENEFENRNESIKEAQFRICQLPRYQCNEEHQSFANWMSPKNR